MSYEADPKHANQIVKEVGLEESSKKADRPGLEEIDLGTEMNTEELGKPEATEFRKICLRAKYLGQGRLDTQHATGVL